MPWGQEIEIDMPEPQIHRGRIRTFRLSPSDRLVASGLVAFFSLSIGVSLCTMRPTARRGPLFDGAVDLCADREGIEFPTQGKPPARPARAIPPPPVKRKGDSECTCPNDPPFRDIFDVLIRHRGAFLSQIIDRRIRRDIFQGVRELTQVIHDFLQHDNDNPKLFI